MGGVGAASSESCWMGESWRIIGSIPYYIWQCRCKAFTGWRLAHRLLEIASQVRVRPTQLLGTVGPDVRIRMEELAHMSDARKSWMHDCGEVR